MMTRCKTYTVSNIHQVDQVVRELRGRGYLAWTEGMSGETVLCTNATGLAINLAAGHGLWATLLHDGLPVSD